MPDWMKNRALKKRVISEVLDPAGACSLSRDVFLLELLRDYSIEIELGRAHDGAELWFRMTWRCPRYPVVMRHVLSESPDLYEALRGGVRSSFARDEFGSFRSGLATFELREDVLVIPSFMNRRGELREKQFPAAEYLRQLARLNDMVALMDECDFGLSGQVLAALDGIWSYLFLASNCGLPPETIMARFDNDDFAITRKAWRFRNPLTRDHVIVFQRAFAESGAFRGGE